MKPVRVSPFLCIKLVCPSRYFREEFLKQPVPGPMARAFASSWLHRATAKALKGEEAPSFRWPRRVVLNEGEDLGQLEAMAKNALEAFKGRYLAPLRRRGAVAEERLEAHLKNLGQPVILTGRVDARVGGEVWDWKIGDPERAKEQLQDYLFLLHQWGETPSGPPDRIRARAKEHVEAWDGGLVGRVLHRMRMHLERLSKITPTHHPPQPGGHCQFCPYALSCPEAPNLRRPLVDTWTGKVTKLAHGGAAE